MGFSKYLSNVHNVAKSLIDKLLEKYEYASILGTHITGYRMSVSPKIHLIIVSILYPL